MRFNDRSEVKVEVKKEQGQYPAILPIDQAWSMRDLLYGQKQIFYLRDQRGKSILPSREANQNAEFALAWPLADSPI